MNDSLLLSAIPDEISTLNERVPLGWHIKNIGVGAIIAAINTTKLLQELKPKKVLFIGTCGTYDNSLAIGDFLIVSEVIHTSLDLIKGRSYKPSIEASCWSATLNINIPTIISNKLIVATTPGITKTIDGAKQLSLLAAVENLELAGVFAACYGENIPCGAILVVTNKVGPEAHIQWKLYNKMASKKLVTALENSGYFT